MSQTEMSMGLAVGLGLLVGVQMDNIAIGLAIGEGYNNKKKKPGDEQVLPGAPWAGS